MFGIKVFCGVLSVTLGHTCFYKVGLSSVRNMDDDQFAKLMSEMNEIKKSQRDTNNKLREFRKEVSSVQEKTTKELSQKIAKSGYIFQRKGHEHQFNFNTGVQDNILLQPKMNWSS